MVPKQALTYDRRFKVDHDSPGDVLPVTSLTEEGVECIVLLAGGGITRHHTIGLDPVLQAVQLPAGVTHLDSGLADMDRDTFTLWLMKNRKG